MAISVDPSTFTITVPTADLTLVQTTPSYIYDLPLNDFRMWLKDWEDNEGITFLKTHAHSTEVSLGGLTYARVIEILDPYTITFEDGQYAVNLTGANSNVGDKVNLNQVSVRSQNSAGLTSSPDIEYSSFGGGVTIDVNSGNAGTVFPTGTPRQKVDNLTDALLIDDYRGFGKFYIHSDMTLNSGSDLNNKVFEGKSHIDTQIIFDISALAQGVVISKADVAGVLDGDTEIDNCLIGDLVFFNGHIHDCGLYGTIYLDGNEDAVIGDCVTIDQDTPPTIDMGGTGQSLSMPNYSGLLTITNLTDTTANVGIGLNAGAVVIDSSVTAGNFIIAGSGLVYDYSTGTTSVNTDGLMNRELITKATWDEVFYDSTSTETGTTFPVGTLNHPTNNLADAITIANENNIHRIAVMTNLTLSQSVDGFIFTGTKTQLIYINNQSTIGTQFILLKITGTQLTPIKLDTCQMDNIQNLAGSYKGCVMNTTTPMLIKAGADIFMNNCRSGVPGSASPVLDYTNGGVGLNNRAYSGGIRVQNSTDASNITTMEFVAGKFNFDNTTNTHGEFHVRGVVDCNGVEKPVAVNIAMVANGALCRTQIAGEVWDTTLADHVDAGSTGEALDNVSGGSSPDAIASAVWDKATADHTTTGSFGKLIQFVKLLLLK